MSTNVQNVQFTDTENQRWEQFTHWKDAGLTDINIALKWHLKSTKQVQRLKKKAKENGAYRKWTDDKTNWIAEEFPVLHAQIKAKHPKLAYVTIATMYGKTIPQHIEVPSGEDEHDVQDFNLNELPTDERKLVEHAVSVYLKGRGKARPEDIH